jgi:glycosyltransferase involved in cell wall biosynthesis
MPEDTRKPLVSIIVPSYNQGRYIRDTIESCLAQDYRPLEVVIVDGASKDNTLDVLHQYDHVPEVRWVSEKDSGVAEAVNKGFRLAKGEIAGIQSSDDGYLPGAVSEAVKHFGESPELGIVYGDLVYVDAGGKELRRSQTAPYSLENFLSTRTLILQPAAFFRLALARSVGGWNPDYFVCDTEMWLRMVFRAPARKVDSFWGMRRMHPEQRNTQEAKIVASYSRMMDASPDIAKSPRRLRRAAQCGKYLIADGYNPSGNRFLRFCNHWRAFLAYPDIAKTQRIAAELFPGYWHFRRWRSRLSRGLGKLKRMVWQKA